jgi:Uma2 family endonuclease
VKRAYVVDPTDPRAPAQAVWDALSEQERRLVLAELPSEIPLAEPPEGDPHRIPKVRALEALGEYYRRLKRTVYLSSELPVYYPDESVFAPDLIAVLDVDPGPRDKWVVVQERRGLDFVLEVTVSGNRKKDFQDNVVRYARLGIPEYFIYDPVTPRLMGYRQTSGRVAQYQPIVPQGGRWESAVLGLELALETGKLRFFHGTAPLLDAPELIDRLGGMVDAVVARETALAGALEAERERADSAEQKAVSAEQKAARLAERLRELGVDPDDV